MENSLNGIYKRLNTSLANRLCSKWLHVPMTKNANPNCVSVSDVDRQVSCFKGIFKRPSMRDLVKDARDLHIGIQTIQSYIEVFNCDIDFYQGDIVEDCEGIQYYIRTVEHLERGSKKLTLSNSGGKA